MKKNKIMQSMFKGVIKPKIFLILFAFFFSSLAFAAALTHTFLDGRIPAGNANCTSFDGDLLDQDATEDPLDVAFSTDGLMVFTVNAKQQQDREVGNLSMNRLSTPFDMTSEKTGNCNDLDAFRINLASSSELTSKLENIQVVDDGKKFFIMDSNGELGRFDLSTPNEFDTFTYAGKLSFSNEKDSFAISRDGRKVFTLNSTTNAPTVTTFSLPEPYSVSSRTEIHQVNLTNIGLELNDDSLTFDDFGRDIEFNNTGSAMFILMSNASKDGEVRKYSFIHQFKLGKNFDVSTAEYVGKYQVAGFGNVPANREGTGAPRGFVFSPDGMKIFIVQILGGDGVDQINEFQLECPYGVVACVSDSTSSMGSQVELSKQNINLNISTIFKRFEWIKRNRDQEDLSSHNINLNYPNPLLKAVAMNLEPTAKKTIASLVSINQEKEKKSKWSTWSLGDLTISSFDKFGFEMAKSVKSKGLTAGADRKFGDNKFLGLAIRYGDNESNIHQSNQNTEMESLTLNIYGIVPTNENRYINAVLGLSAMKFDNLYLGKITGERNGRQAFVSINYRTKNNYGAFNITPTGKFTYGITKLSQYTDFLSKAIDGPTTDVRYKDTTFTSGELSAGFLFETDIIETPDGTIQPIGGIEVLFDLTPDIDYKYSLQGSTHVNKDTILGTYSPRNLKASFGFEQIYSNGFTFSPFYERIYRYEQKSLDEIISERFIIKISRSKEEYNSNFALYLDPLSDNPGNLSFAKNLNGFDLKLNSDLGFIDNSDYLVNFDVSGKF
tara:strand:- start:408 stop:2744 length:2337 start_codon:yes stop_codon:yes gene_type:complete